MTKSEYSSVHSVPTYQQIMHLSLITHNNTSSKCQQGKQ